MTFWQNLISYTQFRENILVSEMSTKECSDIYIFTQIKHLWLQLKIDTSVIFIWIYYTCK